jgi:hypothetical protein
MCIQTKVYDTITAWPLISLSKQSVVWIQLRTLQVWVIVQIYVSTNKLGFCSKRPPNHHILTLVIQKQDQNQPCVLCSSPKVHKDLCITPSWWNKNNFSSRYYIQHATLTIDFHMNMLVNICNYNAVGKNMKKKVGNKIDIITLVIFYFLL